MTVWLVVTALPEIFTSGSHVHAEEVDNPPLIQLVSPGSWTLALEGAFRWNTARPEELQRLVLLTAIQFVRFEPVDWVEGNDKFRELSEVKLELLIRQCKWVKQKYGQV